LLDHTRIIKYHTLKNVCMLNKIKYAYDTRILFLAIQIAMPSFPVVDVLSTLSLLI
jgi:hypothetical protein